jgi:hypothetical protein
VPESALLLVMEPDPESVLVLDPESALVLESMLA